MQLNSGYSLIVVLLLVLCPILAGCSDSASEEAAASTPAVVTTAADTPQYQAGDIVRSAKAGADSGWLILTHNAATDNYERAFIYRNADGTWGYRIDARTETISRGMFEKVNTVKVTHVEVSSVKIGQPTVAATAAVTYAPAATTSSTAATATATATTTTSTAYAPKVKNIDPDKGKTGETVSINNLDGQNFVTGAKVALKKAGETSIVAKDVVVNPILITCRFDIPVDAKLGYWDVVVTNPDGQSHQFQNAFNILQGTVTATPTTTGSSTSSASVVKITQIQDTLLVTGGTESYKTVGILGTNLTAPTGMKLVGPSTITATTYAPDTTHATGYFTIPNGVTGTFQVVVVDSSGTVLATSTDTLKIE